MSRIIDTDTLTTLHSYVSVSMKNAGLSVWVESLIQIHKNAGLLVSRIIDTDIYECRVVSVSRIIDTDT